MLTRYPKLKSEIRNAKIENRKSILILLGNRIVVKMQVSEKLVLPIRACGI